MGQGQVMEDVIQDIGQKRVMESVRAILDDILLKVVYAIAPMVVHRWFLHHQLIAGQVLRQSRQE